MSTIPKVSYISSHRSYKTLGGRCYTPPFREDTTAETQRSSITHKITPLIKDGTKIPPQNS